MTFTIPLGSLVPLAVTFGLFFLAAVVARKLAGGDDSGTGLVMFPASVVALLLSIIVWWAYFAMGAP